MASAPPPCVVSGLETGCCRWVGSSGAIVTAVGQMRVAVGRIVCPAGGDSVSFFT